MAILLAAGLPAAALAYPDGAPWGHAGIDGGEDCTACHFQWDAVRASEDITIEGLPARFEAGQVYVLVVRVLEPGAANGFELAATGGRFEAADTATQAEGGAAHSVESSHAWTIRWHAPEERLDTVRFWLAVNEGNGDESEFGDRIHLKDWEVPG